MAAWMRGWVAACAESFAGHLRSIIIIIIIIIISIIIIIIIINVCTGHVLRGVGGYERSHFSPTHHTPPGQRHQHPATLSCLATACALAPLLLHQRRSHAHSCAVVVHCMPHRVAVAACSCIPACILVCRAAFLLEPILRFCRCCRRAVAGMPLAPAGLLHHCASCHLTSTLLSSSSRLLMRAARIFLRRATLHECIICPVLSVCIACVQSRCRRCRCRRRLPSPSFLCAIVVVVFVFCPVAAVVFAVSSPLSSAPWPLSYHVLPCGLR